MNREGIRADLEKILQTAHSHPKKMVIKESKDTFNIACPLCGDSNNDMNLKRARIIFTKAEPYFHCHHECGTRSMDQLYREFGMEYKGEVFDFFTGPITVKTKLKYDPKKVAMFEISRLALDVYDVMKCYGLTNIKKDSEAYEYLANRNLEHLTEYMAWSEKWKRICIFNPISEPAIEKQYGPKGERYLRSMKVLGFQARDITGKQSAKYLTYSLEKLYGDLELEYKPKKGCESYIKLMANTYFSTLINPHKPMYVVEGPLDALLLDNCMAITGVSKTNKTLDRNPMAQYIFDNDEAGRAKQTEKWSNYPESTRVFDWQGIMKHYKTTTIKDINDLWSHCKQTGQEMPDVNKYLL